ncbi:cell division protein ZapE [Loktanella fryxellensis]|uniref:Cell division protein ZapE n=1 Tax=Loktanella fryxellensis TaxID=245187 RepID=A0A1H8FPY0_9RHOB|nr:cell division protein ZapE [Loktanella fryxellensis]SEN33307.1 cell division protein ZapE [Loktanella fryxellensis]
MSVTEAYDSAVAAGRLTRDPAQEGVLPELDRIRDALEHPVMTGFFRKTPLPVRGLYMWGGVGRGKSMLMDLAYSQIDVPKQRQHFHAFMQWIHAEIAAARKTGVDDAIKPVAAKLTADIRLLAFDEMQISDITDAMIVGRLFEALFAAGVTVITTSNRPPDDLYKNGLNRDIFVPFIDLIKDRMAVHELAAVTDYRQGRLAGTPSYFTPNDATARAAIAAVWQRVSEGHSTPLTLHVQGRTVTLPDYHNGVAAASFYDLCGKPLGAADYLALAAAVRVLILRDIPSLGRDNFNEAKRFVTLIDALYEARVQLICSAAAAPEYLYREGEGSFEFERTASRLREMQADGWGQVSS